MQAESVDRPDHVAQESVFDFDIYSPNGPGEDFHLGWRRLQAPGVPDVVWTPRNGGHWIPTRAALISQVMSDYQRFSSRTIMIPKSLGDDHGLIPTTLDPPRHRPYRAILNENLAQPVVATVETQVRDTAVTLIEQVRPAGRCDFTTDYAEQLPIRIFMALMGLPLADAAQTKHWCDQLLRPDGSMTFAEAMQKLFDYLRPHVEDRRINPREDLLNRLVHARIADQPLGDQDTMKLTVQLLIAGLDTVVNFLGFAMLHLAKSPQQQRELAEQPQIVPEAVEELLRRFPIVTIGREVTEDMDFHGVQLRAGEMMAVPSPLTGIDAREYPEPLEVDFARGARRHLTFGTGNHLCPGKHLARLEVCITLEEWIKRIPAFELAPGSEPTSQGGIVGVVDRLPLVWPAPK